MGNRSPLVVVLDMLEAERRLDREEVYLLWRRKEKMSIYDPPSDPYYNAHECPYCDQPLEDKGFSRWHDWVCVNPDCEHSINYKESEEE